MHARRKQISQKGTRKTVTTTTPNITMTTESRMKVKKQKKGRRLYVKKLHARLGFKKLESCGLLVQFVGCSASYLEEGVLGFGEKVLKVYESILRHRTVVGMFQRGQPCGDTLKSVLNGTDGHVLKSKKVVGYLRTLSKMAEIANDSINTSSFDEKGYRRTMCRNCNKAEADPNFQKSLKACSRCKQIFYCSRECQTMDWKVHRHHCKPSPLSSEKTSTLSKDIITNFISRNGPEILAKIAIVCIETGTKPCDIIVLCCFRLFHCRLRADRKFVCNNCHKVCHSVVHQLSSHCLLKVVEGCSSLPR